MRPRSPSREALLDEVFLQYIAAFSLAFCRWGLPFNLLDYQPDEPQRRPSSKRFNFVHPQVRAQVCCTTDRAGCQLNYLLGYYMEIVAAIYEDCGAFRSLSPRPPLLAFEIPAKAQDQSLVFRKPLRLTPDRPTSIDLSLRAFRQKGLTVAFKSVRGPWRDTSSFTPPALVSINKRTSHLLSSPRYSRFLDSVCCRYGIVFQ